MQENVFHRILQHLMFSVVNNRLESQQLKKILVVVLLIAELIRLLRDEKVMAQQKVAFHDARRLLKKDVSESPSDTAVEYVLSKLAS